MRATVKQLIKETPRVYSVVITLPEPIDFKTGQCMRWESLDPNKQGGRLYSMACPGGERVQELIFTIRILPEGIVSSHVPQLTVGDTIEVKGPFGKFYFDDTETRDIALIAGGSGISVLRAIYLHVLQKEMPNTVHLLFSVLNEQEIIYKEELAKLAREHSNFSYALTLTESEPPEWKGHCNIINEAMFNKEFGANNYKQVFYVCGPPKFIECAENILKSKGVKPEDIKIDRWVF